ncbi:MAG TPA: hypothetical protein VGO11_20830 [Chthoniobacteraceae bacterium]|jgi:tetratricopeptide (TPR) repeat protein|nr:hypothetical protein [Chthoniobacteraceae bacterium]
MKAAPLCVLAGALILSVLGSVAAEEGSPTKASESKADENHEAQLARMRALSQARRWKEQIEQFGPVDFAAWPADQAAAALQLRGQAYTFLKDGGHAKTDLTNAVKLAPQDSVIWLTLAENSLNNLQDDEQALAAYRKVLALTGPGIGWQPMTAANAIARILTDQVKTDEALETLKPWGDLQTLAQTWRIRMLRTYGHIYAARGEEQRSLACFREALRLEAQP